MAIPTPRQSDAGLPLGEQFAAVASQMPDSTAFLDGSTELSFEELDRMSSSLAMAVIEAVGPEPAPVVMLIESPGLQVVAILATLKAGKICVPVDFDFPASRQALILADTEARLILTEESLAEGLKPVTEERTVLTVDGSLSAPPDGGGVAEVDFDQTAFILYTSGSTGVPKGVMQSHRGFSWMVRLHGDTIGLGAGDRVTTPSSFTYTGGLWAVLGSLLNRAILVRSSFEAPAPFLETLARQRVTHLQLMPTMLRQWMATLDKRLNLPDLRQVMTGGETLHWEDVRAFAELLPDGCRLFYDFGSTEAGLVTATFVGLDGQDTTARPPSGPPAPGMEVFLVDDEKQQITTGEPGEIAVRGPSVAQGYWRRPELTAERFLSGDDGQRSYLTGDLGRLLPDGSLLHCGRKDFEVKVRGYRINLEEIESSLRSLDAIDEAAVKVIDDETGKGRLAAYVQTARGEAEFPIDRLREELRQRLPEYMMPASFMFLDRFPLTSTGKLDRRSLPASDGTRPQLATPWKAPETVTEETLCRLVGEVLQVQPVGVRDNLFALGADSLAVFQLLERVRLDMGAQIKATTVFETPTVGALARMIESE